METENIIMSYTSFDTRVIITFGGDLHAFVRILKNDDKCFIKNHVERE